MVLPKHNPVYPTYPDGTAILVDTKRRTIHRFFNDRFLADQIVANPLTVRNMNLVDVAHWKEKYFNKSKGAIKDARKFVLQRETDIDAANKALLSWKKLDLKVRMALAALYAMADVAREDDDVDLACQIAGSLGRNFIFDLTEIQTGYYSVEALEKKLETKNFSNKNVTSDHITPRTLATKQLVAILTSSEDMEAMEQEIVFLMFKFSHVAGVTAKQNMDLVTDDNQFISIAALYDSRNIQMVDCREKFGVSIPWAWQQILHKYKLHNVVSSVLDVQFNNVISFEEYENRCNVE